MPLQSGGILRHRYRIEGVLGQGGMGAVYKAFDINLGVAVAVKENLFTTEEYARQFRREATILASLRHANLPRVTDHFVIQGEGQYLVMDFIQGVDLRERLEKDGATSEAVCLPWFLDICDALAYLHNRIPPILHRDIKPGNIKIMPDGRAMLVDFGLAKVVEAGGTTTTGAKAMTPGFSPPEQYGTGRTDPRTDVYSMGATLYAALTASIPEDSLERAMGRADLTPVRKRNPNVSPGLARVVAKALSVDPVDRYQSIPELAAALGASSRAANPTVVRSYPNLQQTIIPSEHEEDIETEGEAAASKPARKLQTVPVRWAAAAAAAALLIVAGIFGAPRIGPVMAGLFGSPSGTDTPGVVETSVGVGGLAQPSETPAPTDTAPPPPTQVPTEVSGVNATPTGSGLATVTPTGGGIGQIAFASNRSGKTQIYLVNIDGTGIKQLTNLNDGACQPAWSPSGEQLIFTSPCRLNLDSYPGSSLWLIEVDREGNTSDPIQLRTAPGGDFDAAWDPNGGRIAFTSLRDNRPQIYRMNIDGTGLVNLNDDLAHNRQAAWSPTASQIIFTSARGGQTELWLMPAEGGDVQRFTPGVDGEDTYASWSPDGTLVLFERLINNFSRLIVAPFEDRGARLNRVCPQGDYAFHPMAEPGWSPDGEWIVFETWPDGSNHDIAIARSNCSNYGLVTSDPGLDFDADWRPFP
ncbi:MAG: protein kinase [Anaerolineales bacterium]|nr:protein kinase [Anaerolineales bacterium]